MVSERKKQYMRLYNRRPEVKAKKAEYMRLKRKELDKIAARRLVQELLDLGFEQLAFEYALERAPEMLATVRVRANKNQIKASTR
jgi:hypothetical protein